MERGASMHTVLSTSNSEIILRAMSCIKVAHARASTRGRLLTACMEGDASSSMKIAPLKKSNSSTMYIR